MVVLVAPYYVIKNDAHYTEQKSADAQHNNNGRLMFFNLTHNKCAMVFMPFIWMRYPKAVSRKRSSQRSLNVLIVCSN